MVRHLSVVVEAVIRPLYPGEPILRKMCLVGATLALADLCKRFPMVAFHQETQRLACGTSAVRLNSSFFNSLLLNKYVWSSALR